MSWYRLSLCFVCLTLTMICESRGGEKTETGEILYSARDTLAVGEETIADAQQCLKNLTWPPKKFIVRVGPPAKADREDHLIRFPSPLSRHDDAAATAVLEWYMARDADHQPITAPGVVVIHESGRNMTVGRMIARGFQLRGLHSFLLQLPNYGERRPLHIDSKANLMAAMQQGIADARRARDAVAALPLLADQKISLQGTSLGGFVALTTAGLDHGYENTFILLAGGDLFSIIQKGARDAAKVREILTEGGLTKEDVRELTWRIEPNRLAHRIDPQHLWLYSGVFDTVVPIDNARSFAKAAHLTESHHILMPVDHYTGIVLLPAVLDQMAAQILEVPVEKVPSPFQQKQTISQ